jgi:S-adenosyl-L-methionine hydrolase (adenosine-forming)
LGSIVTLTTDFGLADGYQGVLEGIIAGINPLARVIPITHFVEMENIRAGWYMLKTHHRYFPKGTIHAAVVDPGVGSARKIIAVTTRHYQFVGPDNGLFSFVPTSEIVSIRAVTNRAYALRDISPVFHGRDIIAPAAAYLSLGVDPSCLGPAVRKMVPLGNSEPVKRGNRLIGEVIHIDRFGNLITTIEVDEATRDEWAAKNVMIYVDDVAVGNLKRTFSDVRAGEILAYVGSGGHLEIGVRDGSVEEYFLAKYPSSFDLPEEAEIVVDGV